MQNNSGILRLVPTALLAFAVLGAVAIASMTWARATEGRQAATAASELQVAAMAAGAGSSPPIDGLDPWAAISEHPILESSRERDLALRLLPPPKLERATELLDEIAASGRALSNPRRPGPPMQDGEGIHVLLAEASDEAGVRAVQAERQAFAAVVLACVAVLVGLWLVLRSRFRGERARERAEAQAREGRRLEALLDDSPDCAFVIDDRGRITYRSESADQLLGADSGFRDDLVALATPADHEALRKHLCQVDAAGGTAVFALRDASGASGWYQIRVSDLSDNRTVAGHVITARNITNEVLLRDELQRQAETDHLTGLPNRRVLNQVLVAASDVLTQGGGMTAVMILDIDGFKGINDTLGHAAGDELLVRVADRLSGATDDDHVLLRLGGDEFALIAPTVASVAEAEAIAHRLLETFDDSFRLGRRIERVRTSIGIAATDQPSNVAGLVREADVAMYESKRRGGGCVVLHDPRVADSSARADQIAMALRAADHDAEFAMAYQPIVEIDSGEVTALEALLRWTSPELGVVGPDEFIPIAEASGEICHIGKWVIDAVCCQFATWIEAGIDPNLTVSVNVSPRQLADERFVKGLLETAASWAVPASRLVVEVTESTALDQAGVAIARLEQLREAGLRISIDDFGSGYSNLGQLLTVPFDVIKIDRSLLLTLTAMREQAGGDATDSCAIMSAIVSIASVLQAPVVAEGVETEEQRLSLAASGISHVQGYLTGRPAFAAAVTAELCPVVSSPVVSSPVSRGPAGA